MQKKQGKESNIDHSKSKKKTECLLCKRKQEDYGTQVMCVEVSKSGMLCTRPTEHKGQHVACSVSEHDMERWD